MIIKGLLFIFYYFFFNLLIYRFKSFQLNYFKQYVTVALFNLKFITGIFIWIIYTFYYKDVQNNDVHKFYNDALILRQSASESPKSFVGLLAGKKDEGTAFYSSQMKNWERNFDEAPINENRTIIKLNAILMFFSGKTYFVHILFMCFLALTGWVWIFNAVFDFAGIKPFALSIIVLILPSVLFWTSGVMKEPVMVFGLGLYAMGLFKLPGQNIRIVIQSLLLLLAGTIILLAIKFYVLVCLVPASLAFLIFSQQNRLVPVLSKYIILYSLLLLLTFNLQLILPSVNPMQMLVNKQTHAVKEAVYYKAGSRIDIPAIEPNALSVIKAVPVSTWNTLVRPYLWEGKNPMMMASAVENVAILVLIFLGTLSRRNSILYLNLILFLLTFSLSYFALIGICTPVLGNLVRYKAPVTPFFMLAIFIFSYGYFEIGFWGRINQKIAPVLLAKQVIF